MSDRGVALLLVALRSANAHDAWVEFLDAYSPLLYQVARTRTFDEDSAADCYLHICERLARSNFQRLLKFKPEGSASFETWLRVVARNLSLDWHRSQSGRPRPFKAVQRLSALEMEIYNSRFVRRASQQETLQGLATDFPKVSLSDVAEIEERIQKSLSSRHQWILSTRQQALTPIVALGGEEQEFGEMEVVDVRPNPEMQLTARQENAELHKKLSSLPADEQLLVQLRFEQDLSLDEIAHVCGLGDAQRVHRKLAGVLKKLRKAMQ